jgi:hypothetical protein
VDFSPLPGGCLCGTSRYEIVSDPLTLYACHCTDCQTVSGASFTLIMVVTRDAVAVREGSPEPHERSRADGRKKTIFRCPLCLTALWGSRIEAPDFATIYAGTLDHSSALEPVGHIWTRSAQPWIPIPEGSLNVREQPLEEDYFALVRAWKHQRASA